MQQHLEQTIATETQSLLEQDKHPKNVYSTLLDAVEKAMLPVILSHTHDNQSQAAQYLGINRATLRRKLIRHGLL